MRACVRLLRGEQQQVPLTAFLAADPRLEREEKLGRGATTAGLSGAFCPCPRALRRSDPSEPKFRNVFLQSEAEPEPRFSGLNELKERAICFSSLE